MGWKKLIFFPGSRARNEATEDSDRNYPLVNFCDHYCKFTCRNCPYGTWQVFHSPYRDVRNYSKDGLKCLLAE